MSVRYVKGHGTQNDFVLLPEPVDLTPGLVRALCDRRAGLGADGVLQVVPGSEDGVRWFMDHRNADGSLAEMCGNGLRLFALFLVQSGLAELGEQRIGTRAGVRRAWVEADGMVRVEMGSAVLGGVSVARLGAAEYAGTVVSMGNPHLVCVLPTPVGELDLTTPPGVEDSVFPDGVNVEFVNVLDEPVSGADAHVRMRVYERGVGETYACGTGACAVAATVLAGLGGVDGGIGGMGDGVDTVAVDQPGGRVLVTVDAQGAWLCGPAVIVGSGELDRDWLASASG